MNTEFQARDPLAALLPGWFTNACASIDVSPKKAVEYLGLLALLTGIYYCYFVRDAKLAMCPPDETISFGELGGLMLKFFLLTSWPFAVVACCDAEWDAKDAGNIFLAAYLLTNVLWYFKTGCAPCIFAAAFRIIPYVFCAMIAHGLGSVRHRRGGTPSAV
ncbi:MAG: hypothetical protein U1F65_04380 [Verrucomicrobiota bacterium]